MPRVTLTDEELSFIQPQLEKFRHGRIRKDGFNAGLDRAREIVRESNLTDTIKDLLEEQLQDAKKS